MTEYKDNNPWAGLSSYEDPERVKRDGREPKLFCGRDEESHCVAQLVGSNIFVTLYGKSGTGKTSLLNAGVFPRLRAKRYMPVSIRLSMDALSISFQECIVKRLTQTVEEIQGQCNTIEVVPESADEQAPDHLWRFFARTRFADSEGRTLFPVIVLDQFEEIFRNRRDEAEVLLRQIAYLMDESHALPARVVDGQSYKYDFNFRFVASIREDDLYRLEDSIDNNYLSELKRCRYRLRSLSEQGARDAILIPGGNYFNPDEQEAIVRAIVEKSRNEDGSISTNIISLLCSRIFADFQRSAADHISPALVDNFIKGNPFERFYNEATRGFSNREKSYIEEHFVDSTGRRNSIPESDFLLRVPKGAQLLEGETRILQRTSTSSDGSNNRVELIHDSFCEPLAGLKEKREKRRRMKWLILAAAVVLLCAGVTAYIASINQQSQIRLSRMLGDKALRLVDDGGSYTARLIALEALPPYSPYTPEAEYALRKADMHNSAILRGHTSNVNSATFSPDGKWIVSASDDNTVRIWDAETGAEIKTLPGHTDNVRSANFSPDGKQIVSASEDETVKIWDAETGDEITTLIGHTYNVRSANFSPDGKQIVSASIDGEIKIWDAQTGEEIKPLTGHTDAVNSANFSPDGKQIVSASADDAIKMWDAETGAEIKTLTGHTDRVTSANFSPNGKRIVSASWDQTIKIWDAETGAEIKTLTGHRGRVTSANFSPNGKRIVSASWDQTIKIWDAETGAEIQTLTGHKWSVNSANFSPDGKRIVSASWDDAIKMWDAETGDEITTLIGHTYNVRSANFSPDGKQIVSASIDGEIKIWDAQTGEEIKPLTGHTDAVNSANFSPDGKQIVSASNDETIKIWDAQTGAEIKTLTGHTWSVNSANFSPNGKRIVSASIDGEIKIWDAETGDEIKTLIGHTRGVTYANFSPDGKQIVSASQDRTIKIWDAETGEEIRTLRCHNLVFSANFSPDGRYIVSASDKTIKIWDVETGREIQMLTGHTDYVNFANFSPDGKKIVSASEDKTIKIWDFPTLEELIDRTTKRFKNRPLTPEERQQYYLD